MEMVHVMFAMLCGTYPAHVIGRFNSLIVSLQDFSNGGGELVKST